MSEKANRLMKIYSRLRRGPVTIEIIRDWCKRTGIDVSERQLYRDLKDIESCISFEGERVVIYDGEKNRKVWKIELIGNSNPVTIFDINTFYLFRNFAPLTLLNARDRSLSKFEELLYKQISTSPFEKNPMAIHTLKSTHFYEFPYQYREHKLLEDCIWAIQNQRRLILKEVLYDNTSLSSSIKFPLDFLPLQIIYHRGCIHLCGLAELNKHLIVLALEQICNYETTNEMFDASLFIETMEDQLNSRFGITENIDSKKYNIEIEFSDSTGDFVKSHFWHKSQSFEALHNGNWLMRLHCGINRELVGWIFQWMSNARVIKPLSLRQMVKNKFAATLELYTSQKELHFNNVFRPV